MDIAAAKRVGWIHYNSERPSWGAAFSWRPKWAVVREMEEVESGPQGWGDHGKGPSTVDILQWPEMGARVVTDVPYTGTQGAGRGARHAPPICRMASLRCVLTAFWWAPYLPSEGG